MEEIFASQYKILDYLKIFFVKSMTEAPKKLGKNWEWTPEMGDFIVRQSHSGGRRPCIFVTNGCICKQSGGFPCVQ